jgi:hypothetical protein
MHDRSSVECGFGTKKIGAPYEKISKMEVITGL